MEYKVEYCTTCKRLCVSVYSVKQMTWIHVMLAYKYYWLKHKETKQLFLAFFTYWDKTPVLKLFDTTEPDFSDEQEKYKDPFKIVRVEGANWDAWEIRNFKRPRLD